MAKKRAPAKRSSPAKALPDVIRRLMSFKEPEILLRDVCGLARNSLGADEVSVFLLDPDNQILVEHEVVGKKLRPTRFRLKVGKEGIAGWVAARKKTLLVRDVRKDRRFIAAGEATRSEAAVPILVGRRLLGVLNFESRKVGRFRTEDLVLLEFFAAQVAIALRMAELTEEGRNWRGRMEALHNIAYLVSGNVPPATMLQRVVDMVRRTCGGQYAAVFQADHEGKRLILRAHSSAGRVDADLGATLDFGRGLIGKAFAIGQVVNVNDVETDPLYIAKVEGVRAEVCVPINAGDYQVGILDAQSDAEGEFTPEEILFLETTARFLAPLFLQSSVDDSRPAG